MRRCSFWGNTALNSGGGIYSSIATSNLLFDSCRWEHNQCALFGGAVYLGDSHFGVTLRSSVMNYNNAQSNSGRVVMIRLELPCRSVWTLFSGLIATFCNVLHDGNCKVEHIMLTVSTAALSSNSRTLSETRLWSQEVRMLSPWVSTYIEFSFCSHVTDVACMFELQPVLCSCF